MLIPPWVKILAVLLVLGAVYAAGETRRAIADAKEIGAKDATIKTDEALLTEIKAQRADFIEQRDKAQTAAAKVPTVVTNWMKDTNSIQIMPGCDGAVDFTYKRVPVLVQHRQDVIK